MTKLKELHRLGLAKFGGIGVLESLETHNDGIPVLELRFGMGTYISIVEHDSGRHVPFDGFGARNGADTFVLSQVYPKSDKKLHYAHGFPAAIAMIVKLGETMPIHQTS